ncbi:MAG: hypothetical protein JNK04_23970 [Myxococcales bacterium]|nr:hypothetical protein [Myxococcales bacterium]
MNVRLEWTGAAVLLCAPALDVFAQEESTATDPASSGSTVSADPENAGRAAAADREIPAATGSKSPGAAAAASDPATKRESATPESHRLNLGMTIPLGGVSAGGSSTLGSLPSASAGYEARMTGPAWFLVALRGGLNSAYSRYTEPEGDTVESRFGAWSAGGTVGVRVEKPVHEYVEVGGYGIVGAMFSQTNYGESLGIGGAFGAGLHFRPTRLFGIRLAVEVLDWGYSESVNGADESQGGYATLKASPGLDFTFSL